MSKLLLKRTAVVFGLLAQEFCPATAPAQQTRPTEIRIGVSNAQSGPSALLGRDLVHGSQAYLDIVNAQGGIAGRTLRLLVKDDRYEPAPALANTNELIVQDQVLFLFDYVGTPTLTRTLPLLRYYGSQEVVNLGPMTGAEPQRHPPYDRYVFSVRASYVQEAKALVDHLYAAGKRKFGLLAQADAFGKAGEVAVSEALRSHQLSITSGVSYRRGTLIDDSMVAQVAALRKAGVDTVIVFGVYGPSAAFIRTARRAGWQVPIACVSFTGADILLSQLNALSVRDHAELTANLLNSQVVPNPADADCPLLKEFRRVTPSSGRGFARLEGWINAVIAVEALRRAGPNISRSSFIRALQSMTGWDPGIGVGIGFTPISHQAFDKVWLTETSGGRWVSVKP